MLPLWIIDLNQDSLANETLVKLLGGLSDHQRSYWYYSSVGSACEVVKGVESCKKLVSWIVHEGQLCVNVFREKGYIFSNLQICIIGHVQEELTQSVFHLLPNMLYDQVEKILSYHANRGIEITGILTVPETVNQMAEASKRRKCAVFLNELNTLVKGRGRYNRVLLAQENQYVGNKFYPQLKVPELIELIFQYLVSAYFCGHENSTIFANNLAEECTFYTLGAASVFYDAPAHQSQSVNAVMYKVMDALTSTDVDEEYSRVKTSLLFSQFSSDTVSQNLRNDCVAMDKSLSQLFDEPDPNPIRHFFKPSLWPKYFGKYFRYLPARLLEYCQTATYALYSKFGHIISKNADEKIRQLCDQFRFTVRNVTTDITAENPTIEQQISLYKSLIESVSQEADEAKKIQMDIVEVPKDLKLFYQQCEENSQDVQPEQILKNLKKELKLEPTVLGTLARCVIMGVAFCLLGVPVLKLLTPRVIYLGAFSYMEWLWYLIFFLLPFVVEIGLVLRRHFKRIRKYRLQLMAHAIWTVNKKLASHFKDTHARVYQEVADFCTQRIEVLDALRKALVYTSKAKRTVTLPITHFNQSLLEGSFSGKPLFDDPLKASAAIRFHLGIRRVDDMDKSELMTLVRQYFAEVGVSQIFDAQYPVQTDDVKTRVDNAVDTISKMVVPALENIAHNIGDFYAKYRENIDLKPLLGQAALNGMFITSNEHNPILVRLSDTKLCQQLLLPEEPRMQAENTKCCAKCCTDPYLMLVSWQEITDVDGGTKCGVAIDEYEDLGFSDELAFYYAFYRHAGVLQGNFSGTKVYVSRNDMDDIEDMMECLKEELVDKEGGDV